MNDRVISILVENPQQSGQYIEMLKKGQLTTETSGVPL
jgi:hypothetical protein